MKKILFVAAGLVLCVACSSAGNADKNNLTSSGILTNFAVTAGSSYYDAVIDHYAGTVKIGSIQNLEEIDGVEYELASDEAVIHPDPQTFMGNWEKEQTIVVTHNGIEKAYSILFTRYKDKKPDDSGDTEDDGLDYPYNPDFLPKDNEKEVYSRPGIAFTASTMPAGAPHPNAELAAAGWKLFTTNEFTNGVQTTKADGSTAVLPHGLHPFDTAMMNESAIVRNEECASIEDGHLVMVARRLSEVVNTGYTNQYNPTGDVQYEHASFRTYPERNAQMGDWFTLAPNMRLEVRYRRTNTVGFNNAIWFQGNILNVPWPDYGEIDLFENPKPNVNQTMHSTLHSANFYSGLGNAKTGTVTLEDMTRWNIYWIELYPEKVVFGVNGRTVLQVVKGANGYTDWPWDQADGFYMILSTGMHDAVHSSRPAWMGDVRPVDFADPENLPSMEFDWVRVYVNDNYDRAQPKNIFY